MGQEGRGGGGGGGGPGERGSVVWEGYVQRYSERLRSDDAGIVSGKGLPPPETGGKKKKTKKKAKKKKGADADDEGEAEAVAAMEVTYGG